MALQKDKLEKFERGEIGLEGFSAEERAELETLMANAVVDDEAPVEEPTVKEVVPPAPASGGTKDEIPPGAVPGEKFKAKADEANTYRQRADTLARQLEEVRAEAERLRTQAEIKVASPITDPSQVWDEARQADMAAKVARLEALVEAGVRGSQEKLAKLEKELADNKMYAEINAFASEFPELRLTRPFEEANKEYVEFTKKLGATPENMAVVDKYFADAAFRAEQEARGVKAPKDYDRLSRILATYHEKNARKYPDYRSAYLSTVLSPEELNKRLNARYLEGAESVVNKIAGNRQETALLDGTKASGSSLEMSEAQMTKWLTDHPRPSTESERATMAQIEAYIRAKSGA